MANVEAQRAEQFLSSQETRPTTPRCGEPVCWSLSDAISAAAIHLLDQSVDNPVARLPNDPYVLQRLMDELRERVLGECGGQA